MCRACSKLCYKPVCLRAMHIPMHSTPSHCFSSLTVHCSCGRTLHLPCTALPRTPPVLACRLVRPDKRHRPRGHRLTGRQHPACPQVLGHRLDTHRGGAQDAGEHARTAATAAAASAVQNRGAPVGHSPGGIHLVPALPAVWCCSAPPCCLATTLLFSTILLLGITLLSGTTLLLGITSPCCLAPPCYLASHHLAVWHHLAA